MFQRQKNKAGKVNDMKVIGFCGVSGSGKSHRALEVASDNNIKYIIDDGLLISASKVLAGKSAKGEKSRLASVRCALFFDDAHTKEVTDAIKKENPESIMILGTSHAMIEKIAAKLSLPEVSYFIEIEDVAKPEEIEKAHSMRQGQGKHVIPVPTFEIKKDFSGYWMDALKRIRRPKRTEETDTSMEKTIIRPTFSYMGEFMISNSAICDIVRYEAEETDGICQVLSCSSKADEGGAVIKIDVSVRYQPGINRIGHAVCKNVLNSIESHTSINVKNITVNIKSIVK